MQHNVNNAGTDQEHLTARDHHRYPSPIDVGVGAGAGAGGSRTPSEASGDDYGGLPEPLGTSELSPVIGARGGGAAAGAAGGAAAAAGPGGRQLVAATASRQGSLGAAALSVARSRQAALLGPSRPAPAKIWRRRFVKILVVGDSGLGKTTLITSLLNTAAEMVQVHDGTSTPLSDFKADPESLVTSIRWGACACVCVCVWWEGRGEEAGTHAAAAAAAGRRAKLSASPAQPPLFKHTKQHTKHNDENTPPHNTNANTKQTAGRTRTRARSGWCASRTPLATARTRTSRCTST